MMRNQAVKKSVSRLKADFCCEWQLTGGTQFRLSGQRP